MHIILTGRSGSEFVFPHSSIILMKTIKNGETTYKVSCIAEDDAYYIDQKEYDRIKLKLKQLNFEELREMERGIREPSIREEFSKRNNALFGMEIEEPSTE